MEITPQNTSVRDIFALLLGAVGPRPIAFASTINRDGNVNLSPFSFFNVFGANPPIVVFSPSRRGRDNTTKDTLENLKVIPEVVISVVTYKMVEQANLASSDFPSSVSEFEKAGFTARPSELVKPPMVKESPVNLECKVLFTYESSHKGSAGNLIICEVLKMHIDDEILDEKGKIDPVKIDLVGRMGGDYYCRTKEALFTVKKPSLKPGIGIDSLPDQIKHSKYLTGNDLGKLGLLHNIPGKNEILKATEHPLVKEILNNNSNSPDKKKELLSQLALENIDSNPELALEILLINTV